ncbi:MAG: FkbM family methyltransferase [Gaiellaceae bacterium]
MTTQADDVFARFIAGVDPIPNWLGVTTRRDFFTVDLNFVRPTPPAPDDSEYFEWLDLLASIVDAGDEYTFIELGAGYGRWVVNAAVAVRAFGRSRHRLVAVEAEPTHYRWLVQHCADNSVEPQSRFGSVRLVEAAVTADGEPVEFGTGNPAGWYGQAIADGTWSPEQTERVSGVRLSELLNELGAVDLIHSDVQGAELAVVREAADALDATTRRLHVGTHGPEVEAGLRTVLSEHGWRCLRDYAAFSLVKTPWGDMQFQDGIQSWSNPRLDSPSYAADYDGPSHVD